MTKSRRRFSSSDLSMEDSHTHKHSKHRPRGRDDHLADENSMAPCASHHRDRRRQNPQRYDGDVESDANDAFTRPTSSRRLSRDEEVASVYRQLKVGGRLQHGVAASSLSSGGIHVHYVPIISNSPTNPFKSHHLVASQSSNHEIPNSKSQQPDANTAKQAMLPRSSRREEARSPSQERSHKPSPRRSKHGYEKRGKHGKKVDPYLEPLKQRWICYQCGRIRSDKIRERHPLAVDQKMQPNWCGRCRISHEYHGRPLSWNGQRHYCWGCGIVRSEKYHRENKLEAGQPSVPNYCKPCREASPGYEHNLREASELGSEATPFDKAFIRQMHDANLSDIEEDQDDHTGAYRRAPGKENDARSCLLKSRDVTSSMLKNRSFKTKTDSDTSSDGNATIRKLKEMRLEADKKLNFGGKAESGGNRLSAGSYYKPPSVESASGCSSIVGGDAETLHISPSNSENLAPAGRNGDCEMKDAGFNTADKACQVDISSMIRLGLGEHETAASPMAVHQSDSASRPSTSGTNVSAVSGRFPSGTSRTSAASMRFRSRRNPAEASTGSPPEREGLAADGNIGDSLRYKYPASGAWAQQPDRNGAHNMPSLGAFGGAGQFGMLDTYGDGQRLTDIPLPPTPPLESHWSYAHQQNPVLDSDRYMMDQHEWAARTSAPSAPTACGHNVSPSKRNGYAALSGDGGFSCGSGADYATNLGYYSRPHNGFDSAAHFSDAHCRRDFSGDSYHDPATENQYEYSRPSCPSHGFAQSQPDYGYGHQDQYAAQSQYGPQPGTHSQYSAHAQYGSQNQPGNWAEFSGSNGFSQSQSGPDLPDDSGYAAPKEFDFSFIGKSNSSAWAANSYVPTREEINDYMERNCTIPAPQATTATPRSEPRWTIYEDEDANDICEQQGRRGNTRAGPYAWRDGTTSIHHVSSSTPGGNTVTILSIREITSDQALAGAGRDDSDDGDDHNSDAFSSLTAIKAG